LDEHPLDLSQNGFAFRQSQAQRLELELGPLQGSDLVDLLWSVVGDGNQANLQLHATASWPMARNLPLISRRSQRRG
jgi:hypothetical protein